MQTPYLPKGAIMRHARHVAALELSAVRFWAAQGSERLGRKEVYRLAKTTCARRASEARRVDMPAEAEDLMQAALHFQSLSIA